MHATLLTDYLDHSALVRGASCAVETERGQITFGALCHEAKTLAVQIAMETGTPGLPVAVYLPKGIPCLTAMMAVLYSGAIYAPLDVRAPFPYVEKVLGVLGCGCIITDKNGEEKLRGEGAVQKILRVDSEMPVFGDFTLLEQMRRSVLDTDPALILFTSGSTGTPKGVAIPHKRIIDYISWAHECFQVGPDTVIGNQAPFLFTVSVMDIFLCLCTGAKLCVIPEHAFAAPRKLMTFLEEKKVSFIFWVPSAYMNVEREHVFAELVPASLKKCLFVGEPMPPHTLGYWMNWLPDAEFYDLYGSTETDMTIFHKADQDDAREGPIRLGRARKNAEVLLLNEEGELAKDGQIGEICIRGIALACGYWNNPEKTAAAFQQNPLNRSYPDLIYRTGDLGSHNADGEIYFHGRKDHQFKHLGYRVEASGIEQAVEASGLVENPCVLYDTAKRQIVLFYTAKDGIPGERELRVYLMKNLPAYMLPTRLVPLEQMLFTTTGKKDRVTLRNQYLQSDS